MNVQHGDARDLPLDDASVACVVTSPPYNMDIEYGDHYVDRLDWNEYGRLAVEASREIERVLVPGGRAWVNVPPAAPGGRYGSRVNVAAGWADALEGAGLNYRDTVVWIQDSHDAACAWGSWRRPTAPNLRGSYELILSFYKGDWKRVDPTEEGYTDEGEDWPDLVRNVWTMQPARRRDGAPAPFPEELPARCIRLSTFPGETVLDPFAGSGTTLRAAESLGRVGLGFDLGAPK